MFVYNPENFDPKECLPESLHKFEDDARYFLHKIYTSRIFKRSADNEFVPLKAEYMRNVMSFRKYSAIRKELISSGVVETDNRFIFGRKCKGYKLSKKYDTQHKMTRLTNKRLCKKYRIFKEEKMKERMTEVHDHLYKYLQLIEIKHQASTPIIEDPIIFGSIQMIKDGYYFFQVDQYGRIHTNITNLKSSLRKHLRYDNKRLMNIDIVNSQPLFFSIILLDYFFNDKRLSSFLNNITFLDVFQRISSSSSHPLSCDILPPDVLDYVSCVERGDLYGCLVDMLNDAFTRREIKEKFFGEILFCRNKPWMSKFCKMFEKKFPNVVRVVRELKEKDYRWLGRHMQKVESSFIINRVVRELYENHPDVFVATIHDSIMTTPEHVSLVKNILRDKFKKEVGLVPRLRVE